MAAQQQQQQQQQALPPPQVVQFETTMGTFSVELYTQHAPKTCFNFYELARVGYYDKTKFHRVIRDFMIQGGDPTGTGRGGESIFGGKFEDEISRDLKHTGAGILSMANSGGGASNGSQFFITLGPCPWLDGKHTIFGRVQTGMQVVQRLAAGPTGPNDVPLTDIVILKAQAVAPP